MKSWRAFLGLVVVVVVAACGGGDDRRADPIPGVVGAATWKPFTATIADEMSLVTGEHCSTEWRLTFRSETDWDIVSSRPAAPGAACGFFAYGKARGNRAWFGYRDRVIEADGRQGDLVELEATGRAYPPHPLFAVAFPKVPYGDYLGADTQWRGNKVVSATVRWRVGCVAASPCRGDSVTVRRFALRSSDGIPEAFSEEWPGRHVRRAHLVHLAPL